MRFAILGSKDVASWSESAACSAAIERARVNNAGERSLSYHQSRSSVFRRVTRSHNSAYQFASLSAGRLADGFVRVGQTAQDIVNIPMGQRTWCVCTSWLASLSCEKYGPALSEAPPIESRVVIYGM
jgi:hypothetical protein